MATLKRPADGRGARGYTYLGVLLLLALTGALLAGLGQRATVVAQRERERELLFRGQQIQHAVAAYRAAVQPAAWPTRLEDLVVDRRSGVPRHHLRRLYIDPVTRKPDWVLLPAPAPAVGFQGVHSRSTARRLLQQGGPSSAQGPLLSDWQFIASDGAPD